MGDPYTFVHFPYITSRKEILQSRKDLTPSLTPSLTSLTPSSLTPSFHLFAIRGTLSMRNCEDPIPSNCMYILASSSWWFI